MGSLSKGFPGVGRPLGTDDSAWMERVTAALESAMAGKINATGTVALKSGAVSTTVSDQRCSPSSVVHLMPTSADGQAALIQWSVRTITNGSFTITHVSTSTSNATAAYSLLG